MLVVPVHTYVMTTIAPLAKKKNMSEPIWAIHTDIDTYKVQTQGFRYGVYWSV